MDSQDYAINEWLKTYEPINEIAQTIHIEGLPDEVKSLALQRTGTEDLPVKYITEKGWHKQYNYMLLLKSESEVDEQRLSNYDWLDKLTDWISEQRKKNNLPIIADKKVINVSCANAIDYQESDDGAITIYSLQLFVEIKRTPQEIIISL